MTRKTFMLGQNATKKTVLLSEQNFQGEICMNPWNDQCLNTNISLYIMYKGNLLPICHKCWKAISYKNIEWVYD